MPRPPAGELSPGSEVSPYNAPPATNGQLTPLSYAGRPVPPAPAVQTTPTPAGLFHAFRRRWVLGTFIAVVCAASAGVTLWLFLPAGKHEVRALVRLRKSAGDNVAIRGTEDYEAYKREQKFLLRTRSLLERTVRDPAVAGLDMIRHADDPARNLEENLSVADATTSVLSVTLKGNNIDEMKVVVDTLVKKYVDESTSTDHRVRQEQLNRLTRTEQGLKDEIEALQRRINLLSQSGAGGDSAEVRQAEIQKKVASLDAEISLLNKEISRAEAELKGAQSQLASGRPDLDPDLVRLAVDADARVAPLAVARDRIADQLVKDEKVATDAKTDPVVAETRAALEKAEQALTARKKQVEAEIRQIESARALIDLKKQIAALGQKIATNTDLRSKFKDEQKVLEKSLSGGAVGNAEVATLRQNMEPQLKMLALLQAQLVELRIRKEMEERADPMEPALGLPNRNLNKKVMMAGGAAFGTFAVVVLLVSFLEWRTRRVDGVDQVVGELGMRIIGTVPAFPNRAGLKAAAEAGGANWRFALNESINSARTLLLHTARSRSMQVVMVTSATQGEGKTSLASQLASSMATAGMRTLIVDCDLRNPSVHKLFDLVVGPGVSEILTQEIDTADAVQPTVVPNLWMIPAGTCSNRVIAALAQGHPLETLFNRLRGQFDFVIVDSCPILPVADALLVGQHVDGVVFSIMQDVSQIPKVLVASEKMAQLNIPFLGAVVNGIKQDTYSYGYNYVRQLPA